MTEEEIRELIHELRASAQSFQTAPMFQYASGKFRHAADVIEALAAPVDEEEQAANTAGAITCGCSRSDIYDCCELEGLKAARLARLARIK